jgi:hypothetical protein
MNKQPERNIPQEIQDLMPERKGFRGIIKGSLTQATRKSFNQALREVEAVLPQIIALAEKRGAEKLLRLAKDKSMSVSWILGGEDFVQLKDLTQPNHE